MDRFGVRRRDRFSTERHFWDYAELLAKVNVQGATAIERAQRSAGGTDIVIPMNLRVGAVRATRRLYQ